jgi:preprotein translocase subunit SecE
VSSPARLRTDDARRGLNARFFGEVIGELRRVTWPTREETMRLTLMVIAVSVAVGLFLGAIDIGFARLFKVILGG